MAGGKDFFDDFYTETMTEMAENFFSRRREVEARLEGFQRLAGEVRSLAVKALRRWGTVFVLLLDEEVAVAFFAELGADASRLPGLAASAGDPWRFRPVFALTDAGRYRKSLRYAYQAARQATQDYVEGTYSTDPKNPLKKVLTPNYAAIKALAAKINAEVETVNTAQSPSTVLAYCKSLDPAASERESIAGAVNGGSACRLDKELAFKPIDFESLSLPELPLPPPLEAMQDALDRLGAQVFSARRQDAMKALARVTAV